MANAVYMEKDETVDHIKIECIKQLQKEFKHNWIGKVIHWELCKILKFDHITKWYMHKPESVPGNRTRKTLWDGKIQMDHLFLVRRPNLMFIN